MDYWFYGKLDKPGAAIGEVKDETDIKAALAPGSDAVWQAAVVLGS
jgi:hypothetical protein